MWDKIKAYGKAILRVATDIDTTYEFAQTKTEQKHDLNNTYNRELLTYAKNIRNESNDEKNWDHMHPLNANEAMEKAEKHLNDDINRYMMSDDVNQRNFGYQMKMDHLNDLYNGAKSQEERKKVMECIDGTNKYQQQFVSNNQIDSKIQELQRQIEQLQKLKH